MKRALPYVAGALLIVGLSALSGRMLGRREVVIQAGSPQAGKLMATTPVPQRVQGIEFSPTASSPCAAGTICEYRDNASKLQLHGSDNLLTQLWPLFSQTNSVGTFDVGMQSDGTLLSFNPNDGYPRWRLITGPQPSGDAQPDAVMRLCWNCTAGGGRENPAYPAVAIYMERHFVGGHPQAEFHIVWTDLNNVEHRLWSSEGHEDDNSTRLGLDATTLQFGIGVDLSTPNVVFTADSAAAQTLTSSPGQRNRVSLVDGSGAANTATLSATDGTHTGSLMIAGNGAATLDASDIGTVCVRHDSTVGANGCEHYIDGTNNLLSSGDGSAQVQLANGNGLNFVQSNNTIMSVQPSVISCSKPVQITHNNLGDNASRPDQTVGLSLLNFTGAEAGAQVQQSPSFIARAHLWNTNGGGSDSLAEWSAIATGTGGNPPLGVLSIGYDTDGSNATAKATLNSNGVWSCGGLTTTASNTLATGTGSTTLSSTAATARAGLRNANTRNITRGSSVAPPDCAGATLNLTVTQVLDSGIATCATAQTINFPTWQGASGIVQNLPGAPAVGDVVQMHFVASAANALTVGAGTGGTLGGSATVPANSDKTYWCRLTSVTANSETATCY